MVIFVDVWYDMVHAMYRKVLKAARVGGGDLSTPWQIIGRILFAFHPLIIIIIIIIITIIIIIINLKYIY